MSNCRPCQTFNLFHCNAVRVRETRPFKLADEATTKDLQLLQVRKSRRLGAKAETRRGSLGIESPQQFVADSVETRSQQAARSAPASTAPSAPGAPARGVLLGRVDKQGIETLVSNVSSTVNFLYSLSVSFKIAKETFHASCTIGFWGKTPANLHHILVVFKLVCGSAKHFYPDSVSNKLSILACR